MNRPLWTKDALSIRESLARGDIDDSGALGIVRYLIAYWDWGEAEPVPPLSEAERKGWEKWEGLRMPEGYVQTEESAAFEKEERRHKIEELRELEMELAGNGAPSATVKSEPSGAPEQFTYLEKKGFIRRTGMWYTATTGLPAILAAIDPGGLPQLATKLICEWIRKPDGGFYSEGYVKQARRH